MKYIYTDGSCLMDMRGGWGIVIIDENAKQIEYSGSESETTNNRMELKAVIEALKLLDKKDEIIIYTDSMYVKNGLNSWISNWILNDWKTSNKKDVKNKDLWLELYHLKNQFENLVIEWVKAHNNHTYNDRADFLATQASASL